jgi:hypothetical protein
VDSSQSNDPFRGEGHGEIAGVTEEETVLPQFNEERWRRVGATDEQVTALQEAWDSYTDEQKATTDAWMRQTSDPDLVTWLNQGQTTSEEPVQTGDPDAQPQQVTETVADGEGVTEVPPAEGQQPVGAGGDQDAANVTGELQTTEPTAYAPEDVPDLPNAKAVEDWVGEDKARAQAALDKERAGENRKGLTAHLERIVGA